MTPAQKRIASLLTDLSDKIEKPITATEKNHLIKILKNTNSDSIWGVAIKSVVESRGDMGYLINSLAGQAYDDPFTMFAIVGKDATILLLRSFPR